MRPPIRQEMCMTAWQGVVTSWQLQQPALQCRVSACSTAVRGVSMQHCSTVTVSPSTELRLTAATHGRMQSLATLLAAVLMSVLMTVLTTFLWQFNSTFLPQCIIINYSHQQPGQRPHATPGTLQPPCSSPRRLSSLLKFLARGQRSQEQRNRNY